MHSAKTIPTNSVKMHEDLRQKTVPGLLLERVAKSPNEVAYRTKKLGIYRERTWSDFGRMVAHCATGLMRLGLKRGERLALMGDPCEEYVICELAAQAVGAITYGIYPASSQKELKYLIAHGGASIFIAGNQEYVDRILPFRDQFSHLRHIVIIDTKGTFAYDQATLFSFQDLIHNGEEEIRTNPGIFEQRVHQVKPTDSSFILYTSGTTGNPKGVLVSHGNHLAATYTLIKRYPILVKVPHRTVVFLPLSHVFGKVVAMTLPLFAPIVPHYGEEIEDLGQTFFEIAPTLLFTVPGYLKKFASDIFVGIENSSPIKKLIYRIGLKIGRQYIKNSWDGKKGYLLNFTYFIFYQAAFRPILNKIGFNKLRIVLSTGATLPSELTALWQIYGVNLCEMYGLSETAGGIVAGQRSHFPRPGDVGSAPACWEVKLSESGEILARGNGVFESYWNNPKLTTEAMDSDGWFHTGDVGEWAPDDQLRILGRVQDLITTLNAKTVTPMSIENILKSSPYINEAVVFGHQRDYLSSLIEIDYETVSDWASRNNIHFTGLISLIQHPEVIKFIGSEIMKANKNLSPDQQIKAFQIIPRELSPVGDGSPLTPTRKVKRLLIYDEFKELVESMYGGNEIRWKVY
jgi:long-chain acyl-CoA synthetase